MEGGNTAASPETAAAIAGKVEMSVKYPIRGDEIRSLYELAWARRRIRPEGAADPMFSGFDAAGTAGEEDLQPEEAVLLDSALTLGRRAECTREEIDAIRNRKRMQAERVLHLFRLGYTGI